MFTVHCVVVPKVAHAPPHPAKVEEETAAAFNVTVAPELKFAEHVLSPTRPPFASLQFIALVVSVTPPDPLPRRVTFSGKVVTEVLTVKVVLESLALVKLESPP